MTYDLRYHGNVFSRIGRIINIAKSRGGSLVDRYWITRIAVQIHRRYDEDKGNNKVAYITYYMFLSLLPTLLLALTIFDIVFADNKELRERMIDSTLTSIPVIGPTLESDLSFVKGRGTTLIVSVLILVWAIKGGALAMLDALTTIFTRERTTKSFLSRHTRAYIAMVVISAGVVAPTIVTSLFQSSRGTQLLVAIVSIGWNAGVIYLIFSLLVSCKAAKGYGAFWGGAGIAAIQYVSVVFINNTLDNARPLYGTLAVVLALMAWISLQVRVLLYAAEINTVLREEKISASVREVAT